ncbi:hypothetical protein NPIL_76561 [Nephila pilipes]|uniref:Uncharacterized protein n=1 Tax=Nephila pilipes TaxID=299642 RepID=A0A8X6IV61_NEPPI|nr:hypothetical protein NPIL_76561 [Nephila pilipes]
MPNMSLKRNLLSGQPEVDKNKSSGRSKHGGKRVGPLIVINDSEELNKYLLANSKKLDSIGDDSLLGSGDLMIHGYTSLFVLRRGKLTASHYKDEDETLKPDGLLFMIGDDPTFLLTDENIHTHKAATVNDILQSRNILRKDRSARCSDLNTMKNVRY